MKLLAFGGSNSRNSINKKLAAYAASLFEGYEMKVIDLNDFAMPLFSVDLEAEIGSPPAVDAFMKEIREADFIVLSLAENNRIYNVGYKNIFDWVSRRGRKVYADKPMLLMAASTGERGGESVLEFAVRTMPRYGGQVKGTFSLPFFDDNFDVANNRISNPELNSRLVSIIKEIQKNGSSMS